MNRDEVIAAAKILGSWAACLFGLAWMLRFMGWAA